MNLFSWNARARNANVEATLNHPCPAQVGFDSDEMVRARTRLQFLAATDDARSLLLKALEAEPTTKELGDAIAFAVSSRRPASSARRERSDQPSASLRRSGLDPDEPAMQQAQAALCGLIQNGDPSISTWC